MQSDEEDDSDEESVFEAEDVESESEEESDEGSAFDDSDASEDASGSDFDDDESDGMFYILFWLEILCLTALPLQVMIGTH